MTKRYTYDARITELRAAGLTDSEIAKAIGISRGSVINIIRRLDTDWPQKAFDWPDLKARYIAECGRLGLRPQKTLAHEMGVSRQRAERIMNYATAPKRAADVVRRLLDVMRLCKRKPSARERRDAACRKDRELAGHLIATVDQMTRAYGQRGQAAREMGMPNSTLSAIISGRAPCGPIQRDRLAAWVERHSS